MIEINWNEVATSVTAFAIWDGLILLTLILLRKRIFAYIKRNLKD